MYTSINTLFTILVENFGAKPFPPANYLLGEDSSGGVGGAKCM